jgi:hypothetical protein
MWRCYPTRTAKPKRQHTFGGHRQPSGDFTGVVKVGFALKALSSALKVGFAPKGRRGVSKGGPAADLQNAGGERKELAKVSGKGTEFRPEIETAVKRALRDEGEE